MEVVIQPDDRGTGANQIPLLIEPPARQKAMSATDIQPPVLVPVGKKGILIKNLCIFQAWSEPLFEPPVELKQLMSNVHSFSLSVFPVSNRFSDPSIS